MAGTYARSKSEDFLYKADMPFCKYHPTYKGLKLTERVYNCEHCSAFYEENDAKGIKAKRKRRKPISQVARPLSVDELESLKKDLIEKITALADLKRASLDSSGPGNQEAA